jgi:sec-independent protein translocase protein TatB
VFDISFAELMIMAVVALLVIGPEKLPKVARTLGAFMGKLQRYVAEVKDEVSREARFEDLKKLQEEIKTGAQEVESSILAGVDEMTGKPAVKASSSNKSKRVKKPVVKKASAKHLTSKKPRARKVNPKKEKVKAK